MKRPYIFHRFAHSPFGAPAASEGWGVTARSTQTTVDRMPFGQLSIRFPLFHHNQVGHNHIENKEILKTNSRSSWQRCDLFDEFSKLTSSKECYRKLRLSIPHISDRNLKRVSFTTSDLGVGFSGTLIPLGSDRSMNTLRWCLQELGGLVSNNLNLLPIRQILLRNAFLGGS